MRLQQAVLLNSINVKCDTVLEVVGCHSSVVRALEAKSRGPGFNSWRQLRFFFHILPFLLSRPLYVRKFQFSFYEGSELNCIA